ncbi:MAG TPA: DUF4143 domain-containing protein [Gammaproteobacteria bacterium]|nr:DUF4143 domain-containing protein [Gammaproteobacteria bacterium]
MVVGSSPTGPIITQQPLIHPCKSGAPCHICKDAASRPPRSSTRPSGRSGSWEGFVVENRLSAAPERTEARFYRTSAGAEVDLVLDLPAGKHWAIEIKRSQPRADTRQGLPPCAR